MRLFSALLFLLVADNSLIAQDAPKKPNVLLIISDDLNTNLSCYGHPMVKTPSIDRIARRGVRFDRAYCQYPVCNPSRTSFLSGRYPTTTGILDNQTPPRTNLKDVVFLPGHFRQHGYTALKVGKIFHTGDAFEDSASWDVDIRETAQAKKPPKEQVVRRTSFDGIVLNAADADTYDGFIARKGVELLTKAAVSKQPFFLAVGFRRPHTPYIAPQKYFDLYPQARIGLPEEPTDHLRLIPPMALTYTASDRRPSAEEWRQIRQAYYASVSFMDAQVGLLVDELDRMKLWDKTIVVFMSDHGYHLGEHGGLWHKNTLFEESARVPLVVVAPGKKANVSSPRLVELVDLYPTLTQMCDLPLPKNLEGKSFARLLDEPTSPGKAAAITVVRRSTTLESGETKRILGRSVRSERWRYTEWDEGKYGMELYDHASDSHEYRNLATDPMHARTVEEMKRLLRHVSDPPQ